MRVWYDLFVEGERIDRGMNSKGGGRGGLLVFGVHPEGLINLVTMQRNGGQRMDDVDITLGIEAYDTVQ